MMICTACGGKFKHSRVRQCQDCEAYLCDADWDAHTQKACVEFRRIFKDYVPVRKSTTEVSHVGQ